MIAVGTCALLVGTATARLVEHTDNRDNWSDSGDGSGRNGLGRIVIAITPRSSFAEADEYRHATGLVNARCR